MINFSKFIVFFRLAFGGRLVVVGIFGVTLVIFAILRWITMISL